MPQRLKPTASHESDDLRNAGLKVTLPRLKILDILADGSARHMSAEDVYKLLLAANMDISLTVPTATSVRTIPAKLMIDNRIVINNHLKRARGGKVSFTHILAWAIVQTLKEFNSIAPLRPRYANKISNSI